MVQNDMTIPDDDAQSATQTAVQGLFAKVQRAVELIKHLREENGLLKARLEKFEQVGNEQLVYEREKEKQTEESRVKSSAPSSVDVGDGLLYLSPDEREALERQIDDLIARINAHLGSGHR